MIHDINNSYKSRNFAITTLLLRLSKEMISCSFRCTFEPAQRFSGFQSSDLPRPTNQAVSLISRYRSWICATITRKREKNIVIPGVNAFHVLKQPWYFSRRSRMTRLFFSSTRADTMCKNIASEYSYRRFRRWAERDEFQSCEFHRRRSNASID